MGGADGETEGRKGRKVYEVVVSSIVYMSSPLGKLYLLLNIVFADL